MSKKPYLLTFIYSIVLMLAGVVGFVGRYFELGDYQFTALIPAFFGVAILLLNLGIKKENKLIAHTVVLLTALPSIMVSFMLIKGFVTETMIWNRKAYVFLLVAIVSWYTLGVYIKGFVDKKKEKNKDLN